MKNNVDKYKYVVLSLVLVLGMVAMIFANKNSFGEKVLLKENTNFKISEEEKVNIINDATSFIDKNISGLYMYFNKSYKDINDLNNQTKLWISYWLLKDDMNSKTMLDYTSDEILAEMRKIFGSNYNITFEDIKAYDDYVMYEYNKTTKYYEYVGGGSGASALLNVRNDFYKFEVVDDKYYITYKPLFYMISEYLDLGEIDIVDIKYKKISKFNFTDYDMDIIVSDEDYQNYKDSISSITYIFEKENDNLVLTGVLLEDN